MVNMSPPISFFQLQTILRFNLVKFVHRYYVKVSNRFRSLVVMNYLRSCLLDTFQFRSPIFKSDDSECQAKILHPMESFRNTKQKQVHKL
jgi:hypothetical protein